MSTFLKPFPNNFGERRTSPPSHRIGIIGRSLQNMSDAILSERRIAGEKSSHVVTKLGITKYTPLLEQKASEWITAETVKPQEVVVPIRRVEPTILDESVEIDHYLMDKMAEELLDDKKSKPDQPSNVINIFELRQKIAGQALPIGESREHLTKAA